MIAAFAGKSRPMDNVKIGMDEPQEDEYAIYRLTTFSPLEQLIFPQKKEYFLNSAPFLPGDDRLEEWTSSLANFYRKILYSTSKRIVSKNPFNSLRIPLLAELFPEARFIHIVRHPFDVVPSTKHLWSVVQKQNILNRNGYIPDAAEISLFLNNMINTIQCDCAKLSGNRVAEIRYEDLEKDPTENLKKLYNKLELPFTDDFDHRLIEFVNEVSGYKKNIYSLSNTEKKEIAEIMFMQMERYQYLEND